jgi:hypothetical protein
VGGRRSAARGDLSTRAIIVTLLALASTARAGSDRTLSAEEIHRVAAPRLAVIKACYVTHRTRTASGKLAVTLVVHRTGAIHEVAIDAPGVTGVSRRKLDGCIRAEVASWQFPRRPEFTTAVLPFQFLALDPATTRN